MVSGPVTFVLPSLLGGGAEFVTSTWAAELAARGRDVRIVLLRAKNSEPTNIPGVRVDVLCSEGRGRRAEQKALNAYVATAPSGALVAMMTRANIQIIRAVRAARRADLIVGISERNIPFAEVNHSRIHVAVRNLAYRRYYPDADIFVAISHSVGAVFTYAARLDPTKVWVVPNPALGKVGSPRTSRELGDGALHLVIPGRLVDKKRPMLAIQVADALSTSQEIGSVTFFGSGPWQPELAKLDREYDIRLPGRVERWFDQIPEGAVCLLPSAVEGFANVLIEAASRGVPCVVGSTAFGSSDAVVPGVSGFFARSDSVDEYAFAVRRAVMSKAEVPMEWLSTFSIEESADVLERALADAHNRSRGGSAA